MVTLTSAGKCRNKEIAEAESWYKSQAVNQTDELSEREIQTKLWYLTQLDTEHASIARLCLRCWLSHHIAMVCYQLTKQFGQTYGFTVTDLWPLVLDDDGSLSPSYQPLTAKILERYQPQQAALSTWASRLTKGHPEMNRFLLERGLYRISDWAILNDTPVARLKRDLPSISAIELKERCELLTAYHLVYRQDRLLNREKVGRTSRCIDPTPKQLLAIGTIVNRSWQSSEVLTRLSELAHQLREHRIAVRRGVPVAQSLAVMETHGQQLENNVEDEAEVAQDDFLQQYRSHFSNSLERSIERVVFGYTEIYRKKNPPKDKAFLLALHLFHCEGLSMSVIAQQVGLKSQVQVSRLLNLKRFRTEICIYWLKQIKQQVNAEALAHISHDHLTRISEQVDRILAEETASAMAEAAAEAQVSKNRETKSTFARRLCAVLPRLKR